MTRIRTRYPTNGEDTVPGRHNSDTGCCVWHRRIFFCCSSHPHSSAERTRCCHVCFTFWQRLTQTEFNRNVILLAESCCRLSGAVALRPEISFSKWYITAHWSTQCVITSNTNERHKTVLEWYWHYSKWMRFVFSRCLECVRANIRQ